MSISAIRQPGNSRIHPSPISSVPPLPAPVARAVLNMRQDIARNHLSGQWLLPTRTTPNVDPSGQITSYTATIEAPGFYWWGTIFTATFAPDGTMIGELQERPIGDPAP
jgi:hypothetical protein